MVGGLHKHSDLRGLTAGNRYFPVSLVAVEGRSRVQAVLAGEGQGAEALWTRSLVHRFCFVLWNKTLKCL